MTGSVVVGGHRRIRPFNTADTYPEQRISNDLCQAVVAGRTVYLRGQVAQDLQTRESVAIGDPAGQAHQVMDNIELLLGEAGAQLDHIVTCDVYLTDIRHREAVYRVLGERMRGGLSLLHRPGRPSPGPAGMAGGSDRGRGEAVTFSLVGRCARTAMLGMVVASSSPAVAARCA
jgi:enamine deaminase RidA (YjgF/YER057c/UK114 family)